MIAPANSSPLQVQTLKTIATPVLYGYSLRHQTITMIKNPFHFGRSNLTNAIVREDWLALQAECEANSEQAKVWSTRVGFFDGAHSSHVLPIHSVLALRAPKQAVEAVVFAYHEGVKAKETSFKRLPLHIACQNQAPCKSTH